MKQMFSFSSDTGRYSREDIEETARISEEYFGTMKDSEQMSTVRENRDWVYENCRDYLNIIRRGDEVIGYSFMLPCTSRLKQEFISRKITEAELFAEIQKLNIKKPEAIYLCASVIREEYRRKGLAVNGFVKLIEKIKKHSKPVLFYWGYSREGEFLANKVAKITGLKIYARKGS